MTEPAGCSHERRRISIDREDSTDGFEYAECLDCGVTLVDGEVDSR